MKTEGNHVQSVMKAVRLLDLLSAAGAPLPLQELSRRAGWPKSTVHGLLSALREYGMVDQSPEDGRYRLGAHLFELGSAASRSWDAVSVSRRYLQSIAAQTGESVHLAMLDRGEALLLESADTGNPLRVVAEKGTRFPLHCTALGKALLAYLPEPELYAAIQGKSLAAYTPHTLTEPGRLKAAAEEIRAQGCAVEDGEYRVGLRAVAAPIHDVTGRAVYSIGVIGMFRRVSDDTFVQARQLVLQAAALIGGELGYRPL